MGPRTEYQRAWRAANPAKIMGYVKARKERRQVCRGVLPGPSQSLTMARAALEEADGLVAGVDPSDPSWIKFLAIGRQLKIAMVQINLAQGGF